jgi:hypothetical protein
VFLNGQKVFSYGKKINMGDFHDDEAQGIYVPGKHQGIKTIEKFKVGFEVCWEHSMGMLQQQSAGANLDLHIIVSAEVPNNIGNFGVTKEGGFVIHASANPDFSGVFQKVGGMGRMLQYREVPTGKPASYALRNKKGKTDLLPAEEVVREFTGKGEDIDPETGKLVKNEWPMAAVMGRVEGWNAVKETKELTFGGSPLRLYEIDLTHG